MARTFEHSWQYEYCYDEGCCFDITVTLKLYYEPAIGKYVVFESGGDPSVGRHWNPHQPPDAKFSSYKEALQKYLGLANRYAPERIRKMIETEITEELASLQ